MVELFQLDSVACCLTLQICISFIFVMQVFLVRETIVLSYILLGNYELAAY
jgi:hypothetical protein